jgi:16S rRNA (guanine527-N7)-methyltransferase
MISRMPDAAPDLRPPASFLAAAEALGIAFEPGDVERLGRFLGLLLEANTRFNLTAVTDPREAWMRHVLDSLTLVPYLASLEAATALDVGSGGGLPGIPLAIVMPEIRFTLLEATGKKARFLDETARALALTNVTVVNERAETAARDASRHRERYDAAIARAVGRLPVLLELTLPFVRVGGVVLAVKGEKAAEEIGEARRALHLLHASVVAKDRTPTGTIVVIEKHRATPKAYPRRPGEPGRRAL